MITGNGLTNNDKSAIVFFQNEKIVYHETTEESN